MTREEALNLIKSSVKNKNLIKHMIASSACMKGLASYFGEDEDLWEITGLLHDIDYDLTAKDTSKHGIMGAQMLEAIGGIDERIINAVRIHVRYVESSSRMEKALFAVDPLTGLIVAATLMHPTKKLKNVDTQFVLNRFKEKSFASGANRNNIRTCEEIGLSLNDFISISLESMKSISNELEL